MYVNRKVSTYFNLIIEQFPVVVVKTGETLINGECIYGLVVFNFGTVVRYKFPYVVVFVVFYYYELLRRQPLVINEKIFSLGKGNK